MGFIDKILLGSSYVTKTDIEVMSNRNRLSTYLPYKDFQAKRHENGETYQTNEFINSDATVGLMWECKPLPYVGSKHLSSQLGLVKQSLPFGTVIQIILMTDHDLSHVLQGYKNGKDQSDPITKKTIIETEKWLSHCAKNGNPKMSGIPVRNFRCFVCVKSPRPLEYSTIEGFEQSLKSSGMAPQSMNDESLRLFLWKFFNGEKAQSGKINKNKEIRRQIIKPETIITSEEDADYIKIGKRFAACLTPADVPEGNDPLQTNALFGGYMGRDDDTRQITTPFFYSLNIVVEDRKDEIDSKYRVIQWQAVGSALVHKLRAIRKELDRIKDDIENKEKHFRIIPTMVVLGDSKKQLERGVADVNKIWTENGFEMLRETKLKMPLFIGSLPFGLYNIEKNVSNIDRHFILNREDITRFLPVQGDFSGSDKPTSVFLGRKGQVVGMNHFDKRVDSYNFGVFGQSGGGKTFLLNEIMEGYVSSGYKIRILDIGGGFEKLVKMKGGMYIDFQLGSCPCINPLDFEIFKEKTKLEENIKNIAMAEVVIGCMAYAKTGKALEEHEAQLISEAVKYVVYKEKEDGEEELRIQGPTAVQEYLKNYHEHGEMAESEFHCSTARFMAYNMSAFCKGGDYEAIFCGESQFDISKEKVVTVELEKIRPIKDLFQVVTLQMMNLITQDLYLGDRSTQTVILVEEVISFLKKNGQTDTSRYADMIEEGYRRARKYHGSFGCVFQSALDLKQLGELGEVINSQAIFKYYLESSAFDKASKEELIPVASGGGFGLELLNSLQSARPRYSEFFIDAGPLGRGVARLCVDQWRYWCNTSDGADYAAYQECINRGMEPVEALSHLSGVPL